MNKILIKCFFSFILISSVISNASASLIVNWAFNDPSPVVGPTDTLYLNATLFNDSSSTETLFGSQIASHGGTWGSLIYWDFPHTINNPYDIQWSGSSPFTDMELNPGEEFSFIFHTLIPHDPIVDPGTYTFAANINVPDIGVIYQDEQLFVTVPVPLPGSLILFISGLYGLFRVTHSRDLKHNT